MTLYRRRVEYDMLQDQPSQSLTDDQLLVILREMRVDHPQFGETMAMGHLRARGYHVTRQRLRRAVHATDPIITALRWRGGLTSRRPYSVPGPNSLWHIGELSHYRHYIKTIIIISFLCRWPSQACTVEAGHSCWGRWLQQACCVRSLLNQ